jgi:hypothetical protein
MILDSMIHPNDMLIIPSRILRPSEIKYKSSQSNERDVIEGVQIGKWYLNNRLNKTREIRTWTLVLVSQNMVFDLIQ